MTLQVNKKPTPESEREAWWKWDASVWMLLGGLLLLSTALISPRVFDAIFVGIVRALDFRLWPWWYFLVLVVIVAFSIKWFMIAKAWYNDDLDEVDFLSAKKFLLMSITITAELLIMILLHATTLVRILYWPLWIWFRFGTYSHTAAFAFLLFVVAVVVTLYVFKEWLAFVLRPK